MNQPLNALIVELNISSWSARRHDKKASKDVTSGAGANSTDAARVQKNLMAGMDNLKKVTDFVAVARNEFYKMTLPWSDSGQRLIPMTQFFDLKQWVNHTEVEFNTLVRDFLTAYPLLISAQAFQLGQLFDRSEYPTVAEIKEKFRFKVGFLPLPVAGDFRVDAPKEAMQEMEQEYNKLIEERVSEVNRDLWQRLHDCLKHMSERLGVDDNGKKKVFRDSLVDGAVDLCELLKNLNVTNDAKLEDARRKLEGVLAGLDPGILRESDGVRIETKNKIDSVLSSWM